MIELTRFFHRTLCRLGIHNYKYVESPSLFTVTWECSVCSEQYEDYQGQ